MRLERPAAGPSTRVRRGTQEPPLVRWTLTVLALAVVGVFIVVPVVYVFHRALGDGPLAYLNNLFGDRDTRHAIALTLVVAPTAVAFNVVFGVAAAWLIARFRFPGRTLLTAMIDLPFAVSPVVAGLVFVLLFGRQGYLGPWLFEHGMQHHFRRARPDSRDDLRHAAVCGARADPGDGSARPRRGHGGHQSGRQRLADVPSGDAAEHSMGPAVWRHPVQRPRDGRVRSRLRRVRPYHRTHRYAAVARREAVSRFAEHRVVCRRVAC